MAGGRETGGWANTRCFTALVPSPARQNWMSGGEVSALWAFPRASIAAKAPYGVT